MLLSTPYRQVGSTELLHVDLAPNQGREEAAHRWLAEDERRRRERRASAAAAREFLLCRGALRELLCLRLGCSNAALAIAASETGKPFATLADAPVCLGFSVSHSHGHGMIALSVQRQVGVDIEVRRPRANLDGIGRRVFGTGERILIRSLDGEAKARCFYRLWALKEALIKALGAGFALGPAGFEIPRQMLENSDEGRFRFPQIPDRDWRLCAIDEPRFAAALAWEAGDAGALTCDAMSGK